MPATRSTTRSRRSPGAAHERRPAGERHVPGQAADPDADDEPAPRPADRPRRARSARRREDRRPRCDRQRVRCSRRGAPSGTAPSGARGAASSAEPDRNALQSVFAPSRTSTAAPRAPGSHPAGRSTSSGAAPAAPERRVGESMAAIPAAIASPTTKPFRSVERIKYSESGPSWSATKKPEAAADCEGVHVGFEDLEGRARPDVERILANPSQEDSWNPTPHLSRPTRCSSTSTTRIDELNRVEHGLSDLRGDSRSLILAATIGGTTYANWERTQSNPTAFDHHRGAPDAAGRC